MKTVPFLMLAVLGGGCFFSLPEPQDLNVSGQYFVTVTNGPDGCKLNSMWREGDKATDVELDIAQDGTRLRAKVGGFVGLLLAIGFGSQELTGAIEADRLRLNLFSVREGKEPPGCLFVNNVIITARYENNTIEGRIVYKPKTNENPACGHLLTCESVQTFQGLRRAPLPDGGI